MKRRIQYVWLAIVLLAFAGCGHGKSGIPTIVDSSSGERLFLSIRQEIPLTPSWHARFPDNMQVRFWTKGVTKDFSSTVRYIITTQGLDYVFDFPDKTNLVPTRADYPPMSTTGQPIEMRGKIKGVIIPRSGIWLTTLSGETPYLLQLSPECSRQLPAGDSLSDGAFLMRDTAYIISGTTGAFLTSTPLGRLPIIFVTTLQRSE